MSVLIKNGRILDPSQYLDKRCDILLERGKVVQIGKIKSAKKIIDATGLIVFPGLVDIHTHTRFPGGEYKETLESVSQSALAGGYTSLVAMANSPETVDSVKVQKHVLGKVMSLRVNLFQAAAVTIGLEGKKLTDMSQLSSSGAAAFSDDGNPVMDSKLMKKALLFSQASGKPISSHCEDKTLTLDAVMNYGKLSIELGLKGMPSEAEESMVARDIQLARITGGRLHIAHASTKGSCELIRNAKKLGIKITAEATPHHLALTEAKLATFDSRYKMNPPLRSEADRQALIKALKEGVIDAIATDHAPHSAAEKEREISCSPFGVPGLETALAVLCSELKNDLGLIDLINKMSTMPAKIFNLNKGSLKVGSDADVAIFDPKLKWSIDNSNQFSKGASSPFEKMPLTGKVVYTLVGGEIKHADH